MHLKRQDLNSAALRNGWTFLDWKGDVRVQNSIRHLFYFAALSLVLGGSAAQAQAPAALVIEGGTLIDGNGGTPLPNSVIIIEGNRISTVGRKGQANYPANSQVIKADGKFIVPGLWTPTLMAPGFSTTSI